jgi:hypothetical protein
MAPLHPDRMSYLSLYGFTDEHKALNYFLKDFCQYGYSMEPFCFECYELFSVYSLEKHSEKCGIAQIHLYLCHYRHFVNKFIFKTGNYRKWQARGKILKNINNFPQLNS